MRNTFGNHVFEYVSWIQPERDGCVIRRFMPQSGYKNAHCLPLNRYGGGPFCRFRVPGDLHLAGVYAITTGDNIMYVGECVDLSKRFNMGYGQVSPRNCYKGGQETNCRINNLVLQYAECGQELGLWFLRTPNRKVIETELIERYGPPWNRSSNSTTH